MARRKAAALPVDEMVIPVQSAVLPPMENPFTALGSTLAKVFAALGRGISTLSLSYTPFLVLALLAAVYFIGRFQSEIEYLKKGGQVFAAQAINGQPPAPAAGLASPAPDASPLADVPPITEADHTIGNPNAKVHFISYTDYECPFCKSFHPTVKQIIDEYKNDILIAYRHYPLPFHVNAQKQAEGAECVTELGGDDKFWPYTDTIFERTTSNGTGFALDQLGDLAQELGVDKAAFQACLDSGKYEKRVQDDMAAGSSAGVNGTPNTFIVSSNGKKDSIPGALPYPQVKQMLDNHLKEAGGS